LLFYQRDYTLFAYSKNLYRHTQHGDKMRCGGEHNEDVPHFMEAKYTGFEVEDLCNIHDRAERPLCFERRGRRLEQ
jgi:hypothetical protein